jgi:hypothetical protein
VAQVLTLRAIIAAADDHARAGLRRECPQAGDWRPELEREELDRRRIEYLARQVRRLDREAHARR